MSSDILLRGIHVALCTMVPEWLHTSYSWVYSGYNQQSTPIQEGKLGKSGVWRAAEKLSSNLHTMLAHSREELKCTLLSPRLQEQGTSTSRCVHVAVFWCLKTTPISQSFLHSLCSLSTRPGLRAAPFPQALGQHKLQGFPQPQQRAICFKQYVKLYPWELWQPAGLR